MNNPINIQFFKGIVDCGYLKYFLDLVESTQSKTYTSNKIQIPAGYSGAATCTDGATFSINDGEYGTTGTIAEGDTVRIKGDASSEYEDQVDYEFLINAVVYDTWTITTMAEGVYWQDIDGNSIPDVAGNPIEVIL